MGGHDENIVMECEKAVYSTQILIGVVRYKRWEIMAHDAFLDEIVKFDSVEKVLADLNI